jgi:hypothetical protein
LEYRKAKRELTQLLSRDKRWILRIILLSISLITISLLLKSQYLVTPTEDRAEGSVRPAALGTVEPKLETEIKQSTFLTELTDEDQNIKRKLTSNQSDSNPIIKRLSPKRKRYCDRP